MEEQPTRTELGQANAGQHMKKIMGFTWLMAKTKPQCISCKAEADGIPVDEARRDHMASRNARDVQRANDWKKIVERTEVNWHLTDFEEYQHRDKEEGGPKDDSANPNQDGAEDSKGNLISNGMRRRITRNLIRRGGL